MRNPEERIADLERQLAEVLRRLAEVSCRAASPPPLRGGWWLAVLTSSLSYNGTASAEIVLWSISEAQWKRIGQSITVQGFWLNSDETAVPACTLIEASWYRNVWVPTAIYCKVNNWLQGCTTP